MSHRVVHLPEEIDNLTALHERVRSGASASYIISIAALFLATMAMIMAVIAYK